MSSHSAEIVSDLPPAEPSITVPDENKVSVSSLLSDSPRPEDPQITSIDDALPAPLSPAQPSPQLFFPLPTPLVGKPRITLSELVADLGNATMVTPDIATAEMVVGGEFT